MTLSEIVVWFAERPAGNSKARLVRRMTCCTKHDLQHLVQLGILNHYINFVAQQEYYSLIHHARYQTKRRRAA